MIKKFHLVISVGILSIFFAVANARQNNLNDTSQIRMYLDEGKKDETSHPDSAGFYYEKAHALALKLKDERGMSDYILHDIRLLNHQGKFEEALALGRQHIHIGRQLKDSSIVMYAYNEVANDEEYLSEYQVSTQYYIRALKMAASLHNNRLQRLINNNLSSVFISLKDYNTAYTYSTRAYQLSRAQHDTVTMGDCLINMGIAEIHQQKYDLALQHFKEAEKTGYQIPDMTLVADALSDEGLVYYTVHHLSASEKAYQQQENIAEKYDLPYEKLYALFELAVVKKDKKDFSAAEKYAAGAIAIGEKLHTNDELMEMYDTMAVINLRMGKLSTALLYKNKFEAMKDTLMNAQIQTNIHHLIMQYHSAQKDKEIAQQSLRIEKNKAAIERENTWIFIFLSSIIALAIILILSLRAYRHKQKLHQQYLLTLQKQHELNTLKVQMQAREEERNRIGKEMHDDIGSALTTILYLSDELKEQSKEKITHAADIIAGTAESVVDKMNEIIWSMNQEYDTLDDLIVYSRQHAAEFLKNHGLQYCFNLPDAIPSVYLSGEERRNIYLVIKEALHNIVKHAQADNVDITFQLDNALNIIIQDNGKGISNEKLCRFGNGMKNMRQRIESIGGHFNIGNNKGTIIKISCPLKM